MSVGVGGGVGLFLLAGWGKNLGWVGSSCFKNFDLIYCIKCSIVVGVVFCCCLFCFFGGRLSLLFTLRTP